MDRFTFYFKKQVFTHENVFTQSLDFARKNPNYSWNGFIDNGLCSDPSTASIELLQASVYTRLFLGPVGFGELFE